MNKIYRTVYNESTQTWTAVSELAIGHGKCNACSMTRTVVVPRPQWRLLFIHVMLLAAFSLLPMAAQAACTLEQVAGGSLQLTPSGSDTASSCLAALNKLHYLSVNGTNQAAGSNYLNNGASGVSALAAGVGASAVGANSISVGLNTLSGSVADPAVTTAQDKIIADANAAIAALDPTAANYATLLKAQQNKIANANLELALNKNLNNTIAIGNGAKARAEGSIAQGFNATATGANAVAIGKGAQAANLSSIAIGNGAGSSAVYDQYHTQNVFIGDQAGLGSSSQVVKTVQVPGAFGNQIVRADGSNANMGSPIIPGANTAIGPQAFRNAQGSGNVAVGRYAMQMGQGGSNTIVGEDAGLNLLGDGNTAIGTGAARGTKSSRSVSVGGYARGYGTTSVAVGANSLAGVWTEPTSKLNDVAVGAYSEAIGGASVALGKRTKTTAESAVAIGSNAEASGIGAIALGGATGVTTTLDMNTPQGGGLGNNSDVFITNAQAKAMGEHSVAIGTASTTAGKNTLALGFDSFAGSKVTQTVIGTENAKITAATTELNTLKATLDTAYNEAAKFSSTSAEYAAQAAIITDTNNKIAAQNAIIANAQAAIQAAVAADTATNAIAIGKGAQALAENTISIGTGNVVSGANSGAIGDPNTVSGSGSYAVGNDNTIAQNNTFVVGNNVTTTQANSVTLGNLSTDRAATTVTTATVGGITYGNFAGAGSAAKGVVSVGAAGSERQIINVAAGQITATSTDAINGSQLYATNAVINRVAQFTAQILGGGAKVGTDGTIEAPKYVLGGNTYSDVGSALAALNTNVIGSKTHYFSVNSTNQAAGSNYNNDGAKAINSVAIGPNAVVNAASLSYVNGGVAMGVDSTATGADVSIGRSAGKGGTRLRSDPNVFIGDGAGAEVTATYSSVMIGQRAGQNSTGDRNTYLGGMNTAVDAVGSINTAVGQNAFFTSEGNQNTSLGAYAGQGSKGDSNTSIGMWSGVQMTGDYNVSIGDSTNTGQAVNYSVALGAFSFSSVDTAVALGAGSVADRAGYAVSTLGKFSNVDLSGQTYGAVSVGGGGALRQIINLGDGVEATDAVNVRQLTATQNNLKNLLGGDATVDAATGLVTTSNIGGTGQSTIHDAIKQLNDQTGSLAGGFNLQTNGGTPEKVVAGDTVNFKNGANIAITNTGKEITVALAKDLTGIDSITTAGGVVINKDGINAGGKKITNVAAGTADSDAVNLGQLKAVQAATANAVQYDGADKSSVTLGGADGTSITNLKAGEVSASSTDAVNGSQLFATNQKIDNLNTDVNNINNVIGGDQYFNTDGSLNDAGKTALQTYDVSGQTATANANIINAIKNMNEGGIKFFHANDGTGGQTTGGQAATGTKDSSASGTYSTAVGYEASATAENAIAIGKGATASGRNSIAVGTGNQVSGANSGAFGDPNVVSGTGSYTVGNNNTVSTDNTFVLGNNVTQTLSNSVVLGNASAAGSVHRGNYTYQGVNDAAVSGVNDVVGVVSVGKAGETRQIQNVAAGVVSADSTDAINGSQLYATHQALANVQQGTVNLTHKIESVERSANAGTAAAMATAGLPQAYLPGKSMLAISGSTYQGESGYAIGFSTISDGGNWVVKATGSGNSRGHFGATVGAGYQW
ncbi:MAG: YadA-like family protein [Neisseria sp.]|nr:YadA-like family protein [Neisseria sp.]